MSKQKYATQEVTALDDFGYIDDGREGRQVVFGRYNGIALANKVEKSFSKVVTLTSAQILALNATPIEVLHACGAGYAYQITRATARHEAGTAYTAGAGEDITLKFTNASGTQVITAFDSDGFMDSATAQIRSSLGIAGTPVENAAIVAHLLVGEITGGNFDVELLIEYDIIPTDFAA